MDVKDFNETSPLLIKRIKYSYLLTSSLQTASAETYWNYSQMHEVKRMGKAEKEAQHKDSNPSDERSRYNAMIFNGPYLVRL
jgi:hypothetical protein